MTVTARKYNPGFLTDDELVASFCVRTDEFESMMEALREPSGDSNAHQIVIGPRGSGKTSLLLRVAVEIRRDAQLSTRFFPVVFAEESYEVSTAGEFWLEALSRLADRAPNGEDGPDLRRTFEELRQIRDDRTLGDRCLGALQDFADREDRRLVLMVENLNMLFRDMADRETAGWRLRQTLQTEPRILLLASATSRFDEMEDPKRALYDLFRTVALRPLDAEDCATLWQTVTGQERAPGTIRALRILTGGSPRLLTIVARFGAELSFRELMADLLDLVDDHTEYFKSHLDALPAQERRVYLALAELWKPATAREIADRARLETNKCSAQLARLTERGAVEVTGGTARRRLYYLSERLYNIYYLMRRTRGPAPMIEALVRFMEGWYSVDELKEFGARMAREAPGLDDGTLGLYRIAFQQLLRLPSLAPHREELLSLASWIGDIGPDDDPHAPAANLTARAVFDRAIELATDGRLEEAVNAWDEVIWRLRDKGAPTDLEGVATALLNKGVALGKMDRPIDALATWDEVVQRFGETDDRPLVLAVAEALLSRGNLLLELNRPGEGIEAWDEVVRRNVSSEWPSLRVKVSTALLGKCAALSGLNRPEEALAVCDEIVQRDAKNDDPQAIGILAWALLHRGNVFLRQRRLDEALAAWEEIVRRFEASDLPTLGDSVVMALVGKAALDLINGRAQAAIVAIDQMLHRQDVGSPEVRLQGHTIRAWAYLADGEIEACTNDVASILAILPDFGSIPKEVLDGLSAFSMDLGSQNMLDLIQASPAVDLLLPLTTALEMELGLEPRVAKEVEEVAEDIRRDLAERRKARRG